MKEVLLAFNDVASMAEFILQQKLSNIETDSRLVTIKGVLSDREVMKACQSYDAAIIKGVGEIHEE